MEGESEDFRRHECPLMQLASVNIAPRTRSHTPSAAGVFSKNAQQACLDEKSSVFTSSRLHGFIYQPFACRFPLFSTKEV